MDIAGAYPPEAGVRSYRRTVRLDKGRGVEIVDRYDGAGAATLSLMLAEEPMLETARIVLPGLAAITIEGGGAPVVEPIEVSDARLRKAWPSRLYRVLVPFAGTTLRLAVE